MKRPMVKRFSSRKGATLVMICMGLVALLGVTGLTVDCGRYYIAAQQAQNVADAAALAAGPLLRYDTGQARDAAMDAVAANNETVGEYTALCDRDTDIVFYSPGSPLPDGEVLGSYAWAVVVTCHIPMTATFTRVLNATGVTVTRDSSVVLQAPMSAGFAMPMWISNTTDLDPTMPLQLHVGLDAVAPGSFGWLDLPFGGNQEWKAVIAGETLDSSTYGALQTWETGDTVSVDTGEQVGLWAAPLADRMALADKMYPGDTLADHHEDNPRILLVPMVTYLGLSGINASYRIERFAAFYLETVNKPPVNDPNYDPANYPPPQPGDKGEKEIWATYLPDVTVTSVDLNPNASMDGLTGCRLYR